MAFLTFWGVKKVYSCGRETCGWGREKERYINDIWRSKLSNETNHDYNFDKLLLSSYPYQTYDKVWVS